MPGASRLPTCDSWRTRASSRDKANVDTLWRIAEALEIRLSDLFRWVEDEIERRA